MANATVTTDSAAHFFNDYVSSYDGMFEKVVSIYPQMFWAMFHYLPQDFQPTRILELGCGTGNITELLYQKWPTSEIVIVDGAANMLAKTQERLPNAQLTPIHHDFGSLVFPPETSFDLVISSLAVHHLLDSGKQQLFADAYQWLKPGGFVVLADCIKDDAERMYAINQDLWNAMMEQKGVDKADQVAMNEHHAQHDHYGTVQDHFAWFNQAGFVDVSLLWRFCIWGVFYGHKVP